MTPNGPDAEEVEHWKTKARMWEDRSKDNLDKLRNLEAALRAVLEHIETSKTTKTGRAPVRHR